MADERPSITIDASELDNGFDKFLALADKGIVVILTEDGKVTARILPGAPGPRPRRSRSVRITPRRRTGPRYMPPLVGVNIPVEEIDRLTRESR